MKYKIFSIILTSLLLVSCNNSNNVKNVNIIKDSGIESTLLKDNVLSFKIKDNFKLFNVYLNGEKVNINKNSINVKSNDEVKIFTTFNDLPTKIYESLNDLNSNNLKISYNAYLSLNSNVYYSLAQNENVYKLDYSFENLAQTSFDELYYIKDEFGFAYTPYLNVSNEINKSYLYNSNKQRIRFDNLITSPFKNVFNDDYNASYNKLDFIKVYGNYKLDFSKDLSGDNKVSMLSSLISLSSIVISSISNITNLSLNDLNLTSRSMSFTYDEEGNFVSGEASFKIKTNSSNEYYKEITTNLSFTTLKANKVNDEIKKEVTPFSKKNNIDLESSIKSGLINQISKGNYTLSTKIFLDKNKKLTDTPDISYTSKVDLINNRMICDKNEEYSDNKKTSICLVKAKEGVAINNNFIVVFDEDNNYIGYLYNTTNSFLNNYSKISSDLFNYNDGIYSLKVDRNSGYYSTLFKNELNKTLIPLIDSYLSPYFSVNKNYEVNNVDIELSNDKVKMVLTLISLNKDNEVNGEIRTIYEFSNILKTSFNDSELTTLKKMEDTVNSFSKN